MVDVSARVAAIRNATYGKDVRENIAGGQEDMASDINQFETDINTRQTNIETRETNLENTFSQEIHNAVSSNPSSAETVQARQGASTLLANLQSKDNKIGNLTSLNTNAKDSLVNAINENSSQLASIAKNNNLAINNIATKSKVENVVDNFQEFELGDINNQGWYMYENNYGTTGNVTPDGLAVSSPFNSSTGIILKKYITQGVIKVLLKAGSNFMVNFRHTINTNKRYAIWKGSASSKLSFGIVSWSGITQLIQETDSNNNMQVPSEDYWIEIIVPQLYVSSKISFRIWGISQTRPTTATNEWTVDSEDNILETGVISLQSSDSGTATFKQLQVLSSTGIRNNIENEYYFLGRWFKNVINGKLYMTAINQGAEIRSIIKNCSPQLYARFFINSDTIDNINIVVNIDGVETTIPISGTKGQDNLILLANALSLGQHNIRIIVDGITNSNSKWLEGVGVNFGGFILTPSAEIYPDILNKSKGIFIGDSITDGVNVLGSGANSTVNSGNLAYPHICCNILNYDPICIGFPGAGVLQTGEGGAPIASTYVDYICNKTKVFDEYPSFIVVCLGANDSSFSDSDFSNAYQALLDKLKSKYPNVSIFCMPSPNQYHSRDYIIKPVAQAKACYYVDVTGWNISTTDNVHPDKNGQQTVGENLALFIKSTLSI